MKYCHSCNYEFQDWCCVCNDCGSELADKPAEKPTHYGEEVFLTSVASTIEAEIVISLLDSYDIPAMKKYKGVGGYMSIYMGVSNLGADIYVPKNALEGAKNILASQPYKEPYKEEEEGEAEQNFLSFPFNNSERFREISRKIIVFTIMLPFIMLIIIFLIRIFFLS